MEKADDTVVEGKVYFSSPPQIPKGKSWLGERIISASWLRFQFIVGWNHCVELGMRQSIQWQKPEAVAEHLMRPRSIEKLWEGTWYKTHSSKTSTQRWCTFSGIHFPVSSPSAPCASWIAQWTKSLEWTKPLGSISWKPLFRHLDIALLVSRVAFKQSTLTIKINSNRQREQRIKMERYFILGCGNQWEE